MDRREKPNPLQPPERFPAGKQLELFVQRPYRNSADVLCCIIEPVRDFSGDLYVELRTVNNQPTRIVLPVDNLKIEHVMGVVERYFKEHNIDVLKR